MPTEPVSDQRDRTTKKPDSSPFWRGIRGVSVFGLIPAVVVLGAVIASGILRQHGRAHAAFTVNWDLMPSVPNDDTADEVRDSWRKELIADITGFPKSDSELGEVVAQIPELNSGDKNSISLSEVRESLRVTFVSHTNNCDAFVVEFRDRDPKRAVMLATQISEALVSWVNTDARTGSGIAALRSLVNVDDISKRQDELKEQLRNLDDDDYGKRAEIQSELDALEGKDLEAKIGLGLNVGDSLLATPASVVEKGHVERGYESSLLIRALALGAIAGVVGLLLRRGLRGTPKGKFAAVGAAPPVMPPPILPVTAMPPVIREHKRAQPPPIPSRPPPIPAQPPPIPSR